MRANVRGVRWSLFASPYSVGNFFVEVVGHELRHGTTLIYSRQTRRGITTVQDPNRCLRAKIMSAIETNGV